MISAIDRLLTLGTILYHDEGRAEGPNDKVDIALILRACIISVAAAITKATKANISGLLTMVCIEDQTG